MYCRAPGARLLLGASLLLMAGCSLADTERPTSARFEISANKDVQVVTSTIFAVAGSAVTLFEADTLIGSAHQATVQLSDPPRFYIRAVPLSSATTVTMKVDIGSKNWYDTRDRSVTPPESLEFTYGFSGF